MKDFFDADSRPVCFFDSGIGGLNLLCECAVKLPATNFIYFADNYNVPYGSFSQEKLLSTADAFFCKMREYYPSAAVIACNTVTAQCADYLRAKYNFPIIGIQPAVKPAAISAKNCVVLATPATVSSKSLNELIARCGNGVTGAVACPDLAGYIEKNVFCLDESELNGYLPEIDADAVVLGCTHYSFIKEIIRARYRCAVYDGVEGTAQRLVSILEKNGEINKRDLNEAEKSTVNLSENNRKIRFIGGDEIKNRRVFELLFTQRQTTLGK